MIERRRNKSQSPPNRHLRRYEDRAIIASLSTHELFHRLWTKAVGTKDYVKAEWNELGLRINK